MSNHLRIGERTRTEARSARLAVRKFFGIEPEKYPGHSDMIILDSKELQRMIYREYSRENEDVEISRFKKFLMTLTMKFALIGTTAFCDMRDNRVYAIPLFMRFFSKKTRLNTFAHETTHSFQSGTKLFKRTIDDNVPITEKYAARCAMEGLAVFAGRETTKHIKSGIFERIRQEIFMMILKPIIHILRADKYLSIYWTSIVLSSEKLKEKTAEKADTNPKTAKMIWPYSTGLKFVQTVAEKLNPRTAFRLICDVPPESMTEILFPERYLENVKEYVNDAKNRIATSLDNFRQRTGIAL